MQIVKRGQQKQCADRLDVIVKRRPPSYPWVGDQEHHPKRYQQDGQDKPAIVLGASGGDLTDPRERDRLSANDGQVLGPAEHHRMQPQGLH